MRLYLIRVLVCVIGGCPIIGTSQNIPLWSASEQVAPDTFGYFSPRIGLLSDGSPLVCWAKTDGPTTQIWISHRTNGNFLPPVEVPVDVQPASIYVFGGLDLAVTGNRVFVVFEKFNTGIFLSRSEDGGETFFPATQVFTTPSGQRSILPKLITDAAGNPMVSFICTSNSAPAKYLFMRSEDGGLTFSPPVIANASLPNNEAVCECCLSDMVVKGDTVCLSFRANRDNIRDIWIARSTDGGKNFSTITDIDETDWTIDACPVSGPNLFWGNSKIGAVWMSQGLGKTRVYANTFDPGSIMAGAMFQIPLPAGIDDAQNHPDIAGKGQIVGLAFESQGFIETAQDIVFAYSETGMEGLETALVESIANEPGSQFFPALVYEDNKFHLVYADFETKTVRYKTGTLLSTNTNEAEPVYTCQICSQFFTIPPTVDLVGGIQVEVYDLSGQYITSYGRDDLRQYSIDVTNLPTGVYILRLYETRKDAMKIFRFFKK